MTSSGSPAGAGTTGVGLGRLASGARHASAAAGTPDSAGTIAYADADYVLSWLEQTQAPENILALQRRALEALRPAVLPAHSDTLERVLERHDGELLELRELVADLGRRLAGLARAFDDRTGHLA